MSTINRLLIFLYPLKKCLLETDFYLVFTNNNYHTSNYIIFYIIDNLSISFINRSLFKDPNNLEIGETVNQTWVNVQ